MSTPSTQPLALRQSTKQSHPSHTCTPPSCIRVKEWSLHSGETFKLDRLCRVPSGDTAIWIITTAGGATLSIQGLRYLLKPGSVLSIPTVSGTSIEQHQSSSDWEFIIVELSGRQSLHHAKYLRSEYGAYYELPSCSVAIQLALTTATQPKHADESPHQKARQANRWLCLLNQYLSNHRLPFGILLKLSKGDIAMMEFAKQSVKEITQAKGCSRTLISRYIRDEWGANLAEIQHSLRIEWAMLNLRDSDLKVYQVALEAGYASLSAFISAFKKKTGLTPQAYRKDPNAARFVTPRYLNLDRYSLHEVEKEIQAKKKALLSSYHQETPAFADEGCYTLENDQRNALPYFTIGLHHRRETIDTPIDMSFEPFRKKCFFTYTHSGSATVCWKNKRYHLAPGDLLLYPSPSNISFTPNTASKRWERSTVALFGVPTIRAIQDIIKKHGHLAKLRHDSTPIRSLLSLPQRAQRTESVQEHSQEVYNFISTLHQYLDTNGNPLADELDFSDCDSRIIPYHTVKNVKALAEEIGYSRTHFSRKLRSQWQTATPGKVIRNGKLAIASKLLKDTDLSIGSVAENVGYTSVAGFIGAFKRKYNQTPLRYRRDLLRAH